MRKVLILVDDFYEDLEFWYPKIRLEEAGFHLTIAGPEAKHCYKGKHGYPCTTDVSFKDIRAEEFVGVIIPGGYAPDRIRRSAEALRTVKEMDKAKKCIAFICHGGWVPISAHIVKGRKLTGFSAIKDDLENAGAHFVDERVVIDGNFVTSRSPADLPFFLKGILQVMEKSV